MTTIHLRQGLDYKVISLKGDYLLTQQIAERLNVSEQWVRQLIRDGHFPNTVSIRGFLWLVPVESLNSYLEKHNSYPVGEGESRNGSLPQGTE